MELQVIKVRSTFKIMHSVVRITLNREKPDAKTSLRRSALSTILIVTTRVTRAKTAANKIRTRTTRTFRRREAPMMLGVVLDNRV